MSYFKKTLPLLVCGFMAFSGHAADDAADANVFGTHTTRVSREIEQQIITIATAPGISIAKMGKIAGVLQEAGILDQGQNLGPADFAVRGAAAAQTPNSRAALQNIVNPDQWIDALLADKGARKLNTPVFYNTNGALVTDPHALAQMLANHDTALMAPNTPCALYNRQVASLFAADLSAANRVAAPGVPVNIDSRNTPFTNAAGDELSLDDMFALASTKQAVYVFTQNATTQNYQARLVQFFQPEESVLVNGMFQHGVAMFQTFSETALIANLEYSMRPAPTFWELVQAHQFTDAFGAARQYVADRYEDLGPNRHYYAAATGIVIVAGGAYIFVPASVYASLTSSATALTGSATAFFSQAWSNLFDTTADA